MWVWEFEWCLVWNFCILKSIFLKLGTEMESLLKKKFMEIIEIRILESVHFNTWTWTSTLLQNVGTNHPVTQCHIPEEWRPQQYHCKGLRTCRILEVPREMKNYYLSWRRISVSQLKSLYWSCLCMLHVPVSQIRSIYGFWECLLCPLQLYTPLHAAAASGSVNVAQILLESGAEVDSRNSYGNTPLHIACLNGHSNVCSELTYYGADINALNYRGQVSDVWLYCIQGLFILLLQAFLLSRIHVLSCFLVFSTPSFLRFILNTWPFWFIILLE